jgi:PAS domain S-box-containing protein
MTTSSNLSNGISTDAARALRIIESMPGHAWSADADGHFTYISPNTLAFLGFAREGLASSEGTGEFGWRQVVHPEDYDRVSARWRHCLRTGEHYDTEHRLRRADGVYRWFRNSGWPSRDGQGRITEWYGTTIEIEDQKQTEAALRERERELSQLVDMVPSHLWRLTPDGEPTYFNKRMVDFLGRDVADLDRPDQSRLEGMIGTVHPSDAPAFRGTLLRSLATGERFALRYRLKRADGAYRWMSSRAEPMRDQEGRIVQWYGLCHDIDDQVHAEEMLRESERQLQQLIDTVPVQIWCADPDGEPAYINKTMVDYIGLRLEDFDAREGLAGAIRTIVHPDDRAPLHENLRRSYATGEPFAMQYRNRRWDGAFRWTAGRAEPLRDHEGRIVRWYGVCIDIEDEVRMQDALRERERELSQLVDMVPSYLWRLSPDGTPTFFNKRLIAYLGPAIADAQQPGANRLASIIEAAVHPADAARLKESLARSFASGERFSSKYRLRRTDGVYRWVEGSAEPLRDESGRIVQWYGLTHDIDDQLRVEEALRERERSLWQLVETLPAMIDCARPDGEPIYRSRQLREFLGYGLEDLDSAGKSRLAGTLDSGVHPDELAGVKANYAHCLATGEPYRRKHRLRRHDGEYQWVDTRAAPMRNAEGAIVQWNVICLDIDAEVRVQEELRLAREELARASQAASLAELSASIAHEVNQPLAAIVANSHACHRWLSAQPPNLERAQITAERIIRDANAAADVVSRIRALFRQSTGTRTSTSLSGVIAEANHLMAEEAARRRIRMELALATNLPPVALDRVQVQQVLVNLIRNGMDAMDATAGDRVLGIAAHRVAELVQVEVTDRGRGIQAPDKVFEPFFTTKEHGMGMGLAICRSIVESHGGRLWVEPNEPQGTRFIFTLPIGPVPTS